MMDGGGESGGGAGGAGGRVGRKRRAEEELRLGPLLREMWSAGEELDAWVESAEGERLGAHRLVLSAASRYVRALCRHGADRRPLLLRTQTPKEAVALLLHQLYHGSLPDQLPSEMLQPLVALADQWAMAGLLRELAHRLLALAAADQELVIPVWRLARFYPALELETEIRQRLLYAMEELGEQVAELTLDELADLLHDDWLRLWREEGVWSMARLWLRHSGLSASATAAAEKRLATAVRLRLCSEPDLKKEIRRLRSAPQDKDAEWRESQDVVLALGGWSHGAPTAVMETLAVGQLGSRLAASEWSGWARAGTAERPLAYHGVALVGPHLYVVGGFDGSEYYNSVRRWEVGGAEWEPLACMTVARCYVSVCAVPSRSGQEEVWACGGFDGRSRLASAERYDVRRNQWTLLPPMACARSDAAAVFWAGRVYVIGGFDGQSVLSSAEWLDPTETEAGWRPAAAMGSPRSGLSAVAAEDGVLVAGGFDGEQRLASASLLADADAGGWRPLPPMAQPRSNFALLSLGRRAALAVGGYSGVQTVPTCELLLLRCQTVPRWLPAPQMSLNRSALKAIRVPAHLSTQTLRRLTYPNNHSHDQDAGSP